MWVPEESGSGAKNTGVLLVLLMPCTDWFMASAHLGKGDGAHAIAARQFC